MTERKASGDALPDDWRPRNRSEVTDELGRLRDLAARVRHNPRTVKRVAAKWLRSSPNELAALTRWHNGEMRTDPGGLLAADLREAVALVGRLAGGTNKLNPAETAASLEHFAGSLERPLLALVGDDNGRMTPTQGETANKPGRIATTADGRQRIERLYRVADAFVRQVISVDSRRADLRRCRSFAMFEGEAETDPDAAELSATWDDYREATAEELRRAFTDLAELKTELDAAAADAGALLDYSAAAMGPFVVGGESFAHVAGALWTHYYRAEMLFRRSLAIYTRPAVDLREPRLQADWDAMERETMSPELQGAVAARIRVERSQMLRDLLPFVQLESGGGPSTGEEQGATANGNQADGNQADGNQTDGNQTTGGEAPTTGEQTEVITAPAVVAATTNGEAPKKPGGRNRIEKRTPLENKVFRLLAQGLGLDDIDRMLSLADEEDKKNRSSYRIKGRVERRERRHKNEKADKTGQN